MLNLKNYGPEDDFKDENGDWVEELDFLDLMDEE